MTQQFFFYPHILDNLPLPEKGFDVCRDMGDKRLCLYVTTRGAKTFFLRKRVKKKDIRIIIGNYPDVSIDDARAKVREVLDRIAAPAPLRKRRVRFDRAVRMFMMEKVNRKEPSKQKLARAMENFWKSLWEKYLGDITADELVALNNHIAENHGNATANRMREVIKSLFNYAIAKNWTDNNPAVAILPMTETRRKSTLSISGLKKILKEIKREKKSVLRGAFLMLIYGFMRKSEIFSMNWNDLDLKRHYYKHIPLTDSAAVLLENMPQHGKWVFPNGRGGHIVDPRVSWAAIVKAAGLPDVQMNDCTKLLRRHLKWSNQPEVLRGNMNEVLGKLG